MKDREDELWQLLGEDEAPELSRPIWFAIRERRAERRSPLARFALAAASAAAGCAGLMLGLQFGGGAVAVADTETLWPDVYEQGTLFAEDSALDYLIRLDASDGEDR